MPTWSRRTWILVTAAVSVLLLFGGVGLGVASGLLFPVPKPAPQASPSPSPNQSALPSPSPSPTATPTPTPTSPPSAVAALTCKIAVSNGDSGSGGWIIFPGGQFTLDPKSQVTLPGWSGSQGLTQDLALNRWLPVPRDWVTPDGLNYVYLSNDYGYQSLKEVDRNGAVRGLWSPAYGSYVSILSAENEGVYLSANPGLLLVDYMGQSRQLTATGYWQAVGGGYAYGTASQSVPTGAANTILRLDVRSGAVTDFFTAAGLVSSVAGFGAGGAPVVQASSNQAYEVWLAAATPVKIMSRPQPTSPGMGPGMWVRSALGDSHGTWLAMTDALYLYTPAAGLEKASAVTGVLASNCR